MTADLRVAVYPADEGGCGHYRMRWPAAAVNEPGVEVLVGDDAPQVIGAWSDRWEGKSEPPSWCELVSVPDPPEIDVAVFQRPLTRWRADMIPMLQAHGIAVVVELDDDFTCIDPRNPAFLPAERCWWPAQEAAEHALKVLGCQPRVARMAMVGGQSWWFTPGMESPSARENIARACKTADLVTCSTQAIADRYAKHGRVRVLPNYVPESYLTIDRAGNDVARIGWSGSVATHPGDLEVAAHVGGILRAEHRVMSIVGTGVGVDKIMGCEVDASGWVPIDDYPAQVAQLDIGICPLRDTAFNRAKSWLKPLEMSALGVAWVGSPSSEYVRLNRLGAGVLAANGSQWRSQVGRLLHSDVARAEQVAANRAAVADLTYEKHAWRWAEAWCDAARNRLTAVAA